MKRILCIVMVTLLSACAQLEDKLDAYKKRQVEVIPRINYEPASTEGTLHFYVEQMARQLFDTTNAFDVSRPIIIGTFLPAGSLQTGDNHALLPYGIQMQESFATFATQAGLNIVEFKALANVKVSNDADIMMSREVKALDKTVKADYMLTGTYSQQQNSLIVNVRLIRVFDKTIIAAATDYLPLNSMWNHSKVQLKDNRLYRGEY